jgi:DNA-binding LytR/AlgR family response regulator
MTPIRILLVEDEAIHQRLLRELLVEDLGYELIGPAATATDALRLFRAHQPDMVLVDIQLIGQPDGIGLAAQLLAERRLPVVFLSSLTDAETFQRARAVGPAAYLTKPTDVLTLERTLELAFHNFATAREAEPDETEGPPLAVGVQALLTDACFVRDRNRLVKVSYSDIRWVVAAEGYTDIHVSDRRKLSVRLALRELATQLPANQFVQVQRAYLVNVDFIESLDPMANEIVVDGQRLPISRAHRVALLARLTLL